MNAYGEAIGDDGEQPYEGTKYSVYHLIELWVGTEFVEKRDDAHEYKKRGSKYANCGEYAPQDAEVHISEKGGRDDD